MAFPVSPGHPQHGSDGAYRNIKKVFSALAVKNFYAAAVATKIANHNWEGEIKDVGDSVVIRTIPEVQTFRYKKGMVMPVQNPASPYVDLKIDQGDGFNINIEELDKLQSDLDLQKQWGMEAGEALTQTSDVNVLVSLAKRAAVLTGGAVTDIVNNNLGYIDYDDYTLANGALVAGGVTKKGTVIQAGTGPNQLGTSTAAASAATGNDIAKRILFYSRLLQENNAPREGGFVVLPAWAGQELKDVGVTFGQVQATGLDKAQMLTGQLPDIDNLKIYISNNLATTTEAVENSSVLFGNSYGLTFAMQIVKERLIDNPFQFGTLLQGVQAYGSEVVKAGFIGVDFIKHA